MFQSLFYWITYSYPWEPYQMEKNIGVSILILLDYLFLLYCVYIELNFDTGFNPYFTGLPILIQSYGVYCPVTSKFQSLFYWITYSYLKANFSGKNHDVVSILILLDYLFLLSNELFERTVSTAFQSLFYWITYSYRSGTRSLAALSSFNPYFTGLPILIKR